MLRSLKAETLTRYSAWHAVDYTQSSPVSHLLPFYNMFDMDHTCHVSASLAVSFKDGNDVWSVGWLVSQSFQHFPPEQDLFTSNGVGCSWCLARMSTTAQEIRNEQIAIVEHIHPSMGMNT